MSAPDISNETVDIEGLEEIMDDDMVLIHDYFADFIPFLLSGRF